jgi:AraC-type DNA-binding domain-containing proteins
MRLSMHGRFTLPAGWCMLGYIHRAGERSWCHAIPLAADTAFAIMADRECDFRLGAGTQASFIVMPADALQASMGSIDPVAIEPLLLPRLLNVSNASASGSLRETYRRLRQHVMLRAERGDKGSQAEPLDLDGVIESHLAACLASPRHDFPSCTRGQRRHYLIVRRTEQFMRINLRNDIYVDQMCFAAEISERALRYAFDDLLGVSPMRYLSMLRLCTACKSLALSDISRRSVKSVAMNCGFHDLSRFAENYRRMFGEPPHTTLMRSPPAASWQPENFSH